MSHSPGVFDEFGVRFRFPENWQVVEQCHDQWPRGVTIESPSGGYWELEIYPDDVDPEELCDQVVSAMREEYENLECEIVNTEIEGFPASGRNLSFFCMDFLVTVEVRCLARDEQHLLIITQAESREFEQQRLVFQAMNKSLLT